MVREVEILFVMENTFPRIVICAVDSRSKERLGADLAEMPVGVRTSVGGRIIESGEIG